MSKIVKCPRCGHKYVLRDEHVVDEEPGVVSDDPPVLWTGGYFGPGFRREPALEGSSR